MFSPYARSALTLVMCATVQSPTGVKVNAELSALFANYGGAKNSLVFIGE